MNSNWRTQAAEKERLTQEVLDRIEHYFDLLPLKEDDDRNKLFTNTFDGKVLKLQELCQPKHLDWKNTYADVLGEKPSYFFSTNQNFLQRFSLDQDPEVKAKLYIRRNNGGGSDADQAQQIAPRPISGADELFQDERYREHFQNIDAEQFETLYDYCSRHSAMLWGLSETYNNWDLIDTFKEMLKNDAERYSLRAVDSVKIQAFTKHTGNPHSWSPCHFSVIVPGDEDATNVLFSHIIMRIKAGDIVMGGYPLSLHTTPYKPMKSAVVVAVSAWKSQQNENNPAILEDFAEGEELTSSSIRTASSNEVQLYREQFGGLANGVQSPVVDPSRFQNFINETDTKLDMLRRLVQNEKYNNEPPWQEMKTSKGFTIYCPHEDYQLGFEGSEAKVYVGLFIDRKKLEEKETTSQLRESWADPRNKNVVQVAVKVYYGGRQSRIVKSEFDLVRFISHNRGVVAYLDDVEYQMYEVFVQELGAVDLARYMESIESDDANRQEIAPEEAYEEKLRIVRGLCLAVEVLHEKGVLHRDLRPPNVLLMNDGVLKICDFGLSKRMPTDVNQKHLSTYKTYDISTKEFRGQPQEVLKQLRNFCEQSAPPSPKKKPTRQHRQRDEHGVLLPHAAPTVVADGTTAAPADDSIDGLEPADNSSKRVMEYTFAVDIFMLGSVIAFLMQGFEPFKDNKDIENGYEPDLRFTEDFSGGPLLHHLVTTMLDHDPTKRPSIKEVLNHPFFHNWGQRVTIVKSLDTVLWQSQAPVARNEKFKAVEKVLQPLEENIRSKAPGTTFVWRDDMYAELPEIVKDAYKVYQGSDIPKMDDGLDHPLPNMQHVIRFCRNFIEHMHDRGWANSPLFDALRKDVPDSMHADDGSIIPTMQAYPGDFLITNRAVMWVFISMWEQHRAAIHDIENRKREEFKRHKEIEKDLDRSKKLLDVFMDRD